MSIKDFPVTTTRATVISMNTNLFDHVNIDKARTYVPNGLEEDSEKACADYNEIIRSVGGIDMQLLGIGGNGHIGFNEPGCSI